MPFERLWGTRLEIIFDHIPEVDCLLVKYPLQGLDLSPTHPKGFLRKLDKLKSRKKKLTSLVHFNLVRVGGRSLQPRPNASYCARPCAVTCRVQAARSRHVRCADRATALDSAQPSTSGGAVRQYKLVHLAVPDRIKVPLPLLACNQAFFWLQLTSSARYPTCMNSRWYTTPKNKK
jgi:hypothetical protein